MQRNPTQIVDAVLQDGDLFLLVQTRKVRAYGKWAFPGGHVEPGESFEEAIHRELAEELNVEITSLRLLLDSEFTINDETPHPIAIATHTFLVETNGKLKLDPVELMDYRWVTLAEAKHMRDQLRSPWILSVLEQLSGKI